MEGFDEPRTAAEMTQALRAAVSCAVGTPLVGNPKPRPLLMSALRLKQAQEGNQGRGTAGTESKTTTKPDVRVVQSVREHPRFSPSSAESLDLFADDSQPSTKDLPVAPTNASAVNENDPPVVNPEPAAAKKRTLEQTTLPFAPAKNSSPAPAAAPLVTAPPQSETAQKTHKTGKAGSKTDVKALKVTGNEAKMAGNRAETVGPVAPLEQAPKRGKGRTRAVKYSK
jgi:hypothetical protein